MTSSHADLTSSVELMLGQCNVIPVEIGGTVLTLACNIVLYCHRKQYYKNHHVKWTYLLLCDDKE